jgi:hypothetical protein
VPCVFRFFKSIFTTEDSTFTLSIFLSACATGVVSAKKVTVSMEKVLIIGVLDECRQAESAVEAAADADGAAVAVDKVEPVAVDGVQGTGGTLLHHFQPLLADGPPLYDNDTDDEEGERAAVGEPPAGDHLDP